MDTLSSLTAALLEWIGPSERPYDEVQEVWRTTCPRLPVWEDAKDAGLLDVRFEEGRGTRVAVSDKGVAFLRDAGRDAAERFRGRAGPALG